MECLISNTDSYRSPQLMLLSQLNIPFPLRKVPSPLYISSTVNEETRQQHAEQSNAVSVVKGMCTKINQKKALHF